jgi:electron transfer flavoprotein beta subunit
MNLVVCIKQVPDAKNIRIDPETNTLLRQGVDSMVNPFDLYALETALRLRDEVGGKITVISMGPPQAESALREALSYGADEAVLLSDRSFAGADTLATSKTLAGCVRQLDACDLVICGKQAIDGDTAQVGPALAQALDMPHVAFVKKIEGVTEGGLTVQRMMDDGFDTVAVDLPALITVVKEIAEPRVPSFKGKMRAKKQPVPVWGLQELKLEEDRVGLKGSATWVERIFAPEPRGKREIIQGDPDTQAAELLRRLRDDQVVKLS